MTSVRTEKLLNLRIGERGPNLLIPLVYGAIERRLRKQVHGDLDEAIAQSLQEKAAIGAEVDVEELLSHANDNYKRLPDRLKRHWSGAEYAELADLSNKGDARQAFQKIQDGVKTLRRDQRRGPGLQKSPSRPPQVTDEDPPPGTQYSIELGPSLYCYTPREDRLGDDLYAIWAWGDRAGGHDSGLIPHWDGTNDLDAGETGQWKFPERFIYPGKNPAGRGDPQGGLYIGVDFWEQDYSSDITRVIMQILASTAGAIGAAIAGAPGAQIGAIVGQALEASRTAIHNEDDDDFTFNEGWDYPRGAPDIRMWGIGPAYFEKEQLFDGDNWVHYRFDFNVREFLP